MCVRLYTQAPQACGGATLKDGANLPLATLCHWISQSRHNALHLWRRRDYGSSPLQRPWSSQSPAGAWHTESLSTWSRCRRGGDSLAGGPVPRQMGSLQGVKPGVEGSAPLSPVPSKRGVSPRPEAMWVQHSQTPPGGATRPSADEAHSRASGFKNPHFRPNLLPGFLSSSA